MAHYYQLANLVGVLGAKNVPHLKSKYIRGNIMMVVMSSMTDLIPMTDYTSMTDFAPMKNFIPMTDFTPMADFTQTTDFTPMTDFTTDFFAHFLTPSRTDSGQA